MRSSKPITPADVARVAAGIRERFPLYHAKVAREVLAQAQAAAQAPYTQFVDGREGAPLESVRFGGVIAFRFQRLGGVIVWIYEQIYRISPVRSGAYRSDHQLWADGVFVGSGSPMIEAPPAKEYMLVNTKPYARRLEHGWSLQAPDGVYEITAFAAQRRFPGVSIVFSYTQEGIASPVPHIGHLRNRHNQRSEYAYPTITVGSPP